MFELKCINSKINFLLRTGKDLVRSQMPVEEARKIISNGTVKESCINGYPINVDDKWYFEGEEVRTEPEADTSAEKAKTKRKRS